MKIINIILVASSLLLANSTTANEIEVTWFEPENYTDLKGAEESDERFQKRTKKAFERYFDRFADRLPEGTRLTLKIKDIDLAGKVRFSPDIRQEVRLVTDWHPPSLVFEFQLTERSQLIGRGEVLLKPKSIRAKTRGMSRRRPLKHEFRLFKDWFEKEFEPALTLWEEQRKTVKSE